MRESDIGDAAQQVFIIAARKLALIRPGTERAFLFQTAMRVASNTRRTHRRHREVGEAELFALADPGPGPEDLAEERSRRRLLDRVLDEMSLETRAVFVLSEIEELTMAEIAALVKIPPGTVASRLRRAREQFREGIMQLRLRGRIIVAGLGLAGGLSSASSEASAMFLMVVKWAAVGASAGALTLGAAHQIERRSAPVASPAVVAVRDERPSIREIPLPAGRGPQDRPDEITLRPNVGTAPRAVGPVAPSRDRASALAAEVASLDQARKALAVGDAKRALSLLSAHQVDFPSGDLAPEATYLRVQALLKAGDRQAAVDLARRFIASFPRSPQAGAMRALTLERIEAAAGDQKD